LSSNQNRVNDLHELLWISAQLHRAMGDDAAARAQLERAYDTFCRVRERLCDKEDRTSFESLARNCELKAAYEDAIWPTVTPRNGA
jgi:hypothetical protein